MRSATILILVAVLTLASMVACEPIQVKLAGPDSVPGFLAANGLDQKDVVSTKTQPDGTILLTIRSMAEDVLDTTATGGLSGASGGLVGAASAAAGALIATLTSRYKFQQKIKSGEVVVVKEEPASAKPV